ncbi:MAG: hypothetical protein HY247_01795 [archaeon]|nr:MAG: hypothetical protein HY247_01795 [archaeon]
MRPKGFLLGALILGATVPAFLASTIVPVFPKLEACQYGDNSCVNRVLAAWPAYNSAVLAKSELEAISVCCAIAGVVAIAVFGRRLLAVGLSLAGATGTAYWIRGLWLGRITQNWWGTLGLEVAESALLGTVLYLAWGRVRIRRLEVRLPRVAELGAFCFGIAALSVWTIYAGEAALLFFRRWYYIPLLSRYDFGVAGLIAVVSLSLAFVLLTISESNRVPVPVAFRRVSLVVSSFAFVFFLCILAFDTDELLSHVVNQVSFLAVQGVPLVNNVLGLAVTGVVIVRSRW